MSPNYNKTIFACYFGYITQAIVNNFAPLLFLTFQSTYGIPLEQISLLISINFVTQLLTDLLSVKFIDKVGYRVSIVAAHAFAALGLILLPILPSVMPSFIGLAIPVVLYAIGGGLLEVLVSPIVEACPSDNKAGTMSLLHSFYCWGVVGVVLISTVVMGIFGKGVWKYLSLVWALVPIINGIAFTRVPIRSLAEEHQESSSGSLFKEKIFWVFVVLMFCAGASELAMAQWASTFAESTLGISKTLGDVLGPCFFAVMMGTGRVIYGKYADRLDIGKALSLSACLCILAYLITVFSPLPILSLVGVGITGLSVAIMWPGIFSLASEKCPGVSTAMFAYFALAGDLGCASGPAAVGFVASAFGDNLKVGILCAVVFPILMIIFARILKKYTKTA